ncbi:MAG: hypothetical protein MJK04_20730, partial [Psychrosphaera sp.]|nr:hypothetical protein [Psychrosphaera sp.]
MRPWPIVFLILSFFTTANQVAAQSSPFMPASNTLALKHYTTKDGLSGNAIRCLFEDHQGILWIGTNKGVSLFDGQQISPLVSDLNSPLSSAVIFNITQADDDSIWIATHYRGVFHYSPHSKTYVRYGEESNDLGLISQTVRAMLIDDAGTLWV